MKGDKHILRGRLVFLQFGSLKSNVMPFMTNMFKNFKYQFVLFLNDDKFCWKIKFAEMSVLCCFFNAHSLDIFSKKSRSIHLPLPVQLGITI